MKELKKYKKIPWLLAIFFFVLFTVTISLFNLAASFHQSDGEDKFIKLFMAEKEEFFQVEKYDSLNSGDFYNKDIMELTEDDLDKINRLVNSKGFEVYKIKSSDDVYKDLYELLNIRYEYGYLYDAYTYQSDRVDVVALSSLDNLSSQKIIGHLPKEENEIMISNYIADLMINHGIKLYNNDILTTDYQKVENYEQLIDENTYLALNNRKVKISGIIDYDLSKYEILKNRKWDELTKEELKIGDDLIRKSKSIYNKIYVKKEFIDSMKNTDLCIRTGIMYYTQSEDQTASIFHELLKEENNFYIKTVYSEDYYHILYLNSILKKIFLGISICCLLIFIVMTTVLIFKNKHIFNLNNKAAYMKKILLLTIFSAILSSILYTLSLLIFRNVICKNYFQPLSLFQFHLKQYFLIFILPIIIFLIYFFMLLKKRFKKNQI